MKYILTIRLTYDEVIPCQYAFAYSGRFCDIEYRWTALRGAQPKRWIVATAQGAAGGALRAEPVRCGGQKRWLMSEEPVVDGDCLVS
jgi:hypothetical protein